jgi:hypothetical protein
MTHYTDSSVTMLSMPTVNFTSAIDRDLLRRAKVLAAKTDTSVNALFNAELRYLVETFEAAEAASNRNFRVLFDFSMGRIDSSAAVEALRLEGEEDLFVLMAQARLPLPRLPQAQTDAMIDMLEALPRP